MAPVPPLAGICFDADPRTVYAPIPDLGQRLGWPVRVDAGSGRCISMSGRFQDIPALPAGQHAGRGPAFAKGLGVKVGWNGSSNLVTVTVADKNVAYSGDALPSWMA